MPSPTPPSPSPDQRPDTGPVGTGPADGPVRGAASTGVRRRPSGKAAATAARVVRWLVLGAASGVLAGLASAAFLRGLDWATEQRLTHPELIWFLPIAGLAVGGAYHLFGGRAGQGSGLLIDEIHEPAAWVPRRMAPMVAVGTLVSHLFGASVGREGTALQMSGSLSDLLARTLRLSPTDRRVLLVTALAAGFGAMFGVPFAGMVFALEVQAIRPTQAELVRRARRATARRPPRAGRVDAGRGGEPVAPGHELPQEPTPVGVAGRADRRVEGWSRRSAGPLRPLRDLARRWRFWSRLALPALAAAFVGDAVVRALGHHGEARPTLHATLGGTVLARVALAGVAFGLMSVLFVAATDLVRHGSRWIRWDPLRPFVGGLVVLVGVALVGRDDLGLSLPLAHQALLGHDTNLTVPLLKLAFTAVCLGSGFIGGEVTPLFIIGATTGAALSAALGIDPLLGAAVGYVAVFAAAANTPIACTVMAAELFGPGILAPAAVACVVAYLCSGHRGIYPTQRVATPHGHLRRSDLTALRRRTRPA